MRHRFMAIRMMHYSSAIPMWWGVDSDTESESTSTDAMLL